MIDYTASLQLIIELHTAAQTANSDCRITPSDQLAAIKKYELAWKDLKWEKEQCIPMLDGNLWELYGGVLAQADATEAITFYRLPSVSRSIEDHKWSVGAFGFPLRDFGMDPSQDLLVLVESPRSVLDFYRWLVN